MNDVIDITATLPPSISYDENVKALSKLFTEELLNLVPTVDRLILLPYIHDLDDSILDHLAWHLHVDFYDQQASREERISLIYNSIAWHRKKGTIGIVEDMVKLIGDEAEVVENWDYGGEPYHFKISITSSRNYDQAEIARIVQAVQFVKNVRSQLDSIEFNQLIDNRIYCGGRMAYSDYFEEVVYTPSYELQKSIYTGGRMAFESLDWRN